MKIFLAISDQATSRILSKLLEKRLPADSLEIISDGEVLLRRIRAFEPYLVVLDILLETRDGLSVLRAVREMPVEKQPEIIFLSSLHSQQVLRAVARYQPACYVTLPCDIRFIAERVMYCCRERLRLQLENCTTWEQAIALALHACGISTRCKGWNYFMEGLKLLLWDPTYQQGLTKRLYPEIGKKYKTSQACVERAMRSAIHSAWMQPGIVWQRVLFYKQPSNGEFLATLANYLRGVLDIFREQ